MIYFILKLAGWCTLEGTATTTVSCLATVRLYLWETVVTPRGLTMLQRCDHKRSASLLYLDGL
jgi:hypothetical protein